MSSIALCMLVRDEERSLARCLDSACGLVDDIIVVDTGSIDGTREIAERYRARVLEFDFAYVDFAAARNFGLSYVTSGWILVFDADETLDRASEPIIRQLVGEGENTGYYFERLNRRPNGEPATPDYAVRLFPNTPEYRYRGRVHETVDAAILAAGGRLRRSTVRLHHDFASDPERRRTRNLRYIEILEEEIAANPADNSRLDFLAAEYHQLGMFDEAASVSERIARMRPLDAQAHLHAGLYRLLHKEDQKQARQYFTEALRIRPGYPEALSFLASLDE